MMLLMECWWCFFFCMHGVLVVLVCRAKRLILDILGPKSCSFDQMVALWSSSKIVIYTCSEWKNHQTYGFGADWITHVEVRRTFPFMARHQTSLYSHGDAVTVNSIQFYLYSIYYNANCLEALYRDPEHHRQANIIN